MKLTIVFRLDLNDSSDGGDRNMSRSTGITSDQTMKRLIAESNRGKTRDGFSKSCNVNWLAKI
ncbi:hypothetical protein ACHAXA_003273 [Cyclostephanos tholiformis]|uniref:Uncharacterized protein n=1 Tax=Cyclostephanos tholiformis TaxID=382380 RepID=A0ABD3RCD2_9STRA